MAENGSVDELHVIDADVDLPPVQQLHETKKDPSVLESPIRTESFAKDVDITKMALSDKELSATEMAIKSTEEVISETRENAKLRKKRHYIERNRKLLEMTMKVPRTEKKI